MKQVYTVQTGKIIFITSNININAHHVNDDDAMMIASFVLSPPLQSYLPRIPRIIKFLVTMPYLHLLHCHVPEAVDCRVINCVQH
jgi:hypothetical protein